MKVRIVLVEPHEAGNVGAAARVMKNFGITDMVIVGPRKQRLDAISGWWASGADDIADGATRVATLQEALADCHLSVATTAVKTRHVYEQLTPGSVAELASESLGDDHRLAIVFGREESGLTAEEIAGCQRTASVPTSPAFPTMNIAMSVGIFCYELSKSLRATPEPKDPAPGALIDRLHEYARSVLTEIGYLHEPGADHMFNEMKALAGRTMLTRRDASTLLAILRQVNWRIGKSKHPDESR